MTFSHRQFAYLSFLFLGCAGLISNVSAGEIDGPYLIRSWQTQQGLPNNTVNAITQTRNGYLWLGTDGGLARFDGVHCRVFGLKDGLGVLQISALLEDSRGTLWIGTDGGGLSRLVGDKIKTYTVKNGLAGDSINALVEGPKGGIWVGTPTGLSCWRNGKFEPAANGLGSIFVFDLAKDRVGDIWAATLHQGVLRFHAGSYSRQGPNDINPRCLLVDKQDDLWVGSRWGSIWCDKNGNWTQYGTNQDFPKVVTYHLAQTPDGVIWAGSWNEGLYYLQHDRFHVLRQREGLSDNAILSLFVSRDGFLWAGTQSGGLDEIGPKKLSVYHVMEGFSECQVRSLAQTTDGKLYVGAYGQGIYHWIGEQFEQIPQGPVALGHLTVEALLAGHNGSLWWGAGPVLYQWKAGKVISSYADTPWLIGDRVWCLCENSGGGLWVGTYNGKLGLLKKGHFNPVKGLSGRPVTALAQEADGTLWIGSLGGGLTRLSDGRLAVFSTEDGLLSDSIRALFLDSDGTLWIGTDGGGLARWSRGRFVNFTTQQGLLDNTVLQLQEDDEGNLWLGCDRGIYCISKSALNKVAAGKAQVVHPIVFGRSDGMSSEACVGNFGAALKTRAGQLCFATAKGIVVINPRKQAKHPAPPKVLLQQVMVNGKTLTQATFQKVNISRTQNVDSKSNGIKIPPGAHNFEFDYTAFDYGAPDRIRFKYELEGLDSEWTAAGDARIARYNYVPPGRYYFRVTACRGNGPWNAIGAGMPFVVLPHFYQALWFEVVSGLAILGCLGGGVRYFERRHHRARIRHLEQERAMENERARIARDLHDELGSSLARISMLSDLSKTREASADQFKQRVEKISHFAVHTARSLDEIVWAVNPRNDSLRSLLLYVTQYSRELFEDTNIRCRYQIPNDLPQTPLPPEMRHNLFLVIKEALNNVLKHAQASEVLLTGKSAAQQFGIVIRDNGVGFNLASTQARSERNGLANMRHRMEMVGGSFNIESAPTQGTTISLTVNGQGGRAKGRTPNP